MAEKRSSEDMEKSFKTTYEQSYYSQNRDQILLQRRNNRKIYMRNYRLLKKVKSKLPKIEKSYSRKTPEKLP